MNFLKKLLKKLENITYSARNIAIINTEDNRTVVIVDGEYIDPKSERGKKILKQVVKKAEGLEEGMRGLSVALDRMTRDLVNNLKNL